MADDSGPLPAGVQDPLLTVPDRWQSCPALPAPGPHTASRRFEVAKEGGKKNQTVCETLRRMIAAAGSGSLRTAVVRGPPSRVV